MSKKKDRETKFKFFDISPPISFEDSNGKGNKIKGIGQTVDQLNKNSRIYPKNVVEEAIEEAKELMEGGQLFYLTGESDHPSDKGFWSPQFLETIINWTEIKLNGSFVEIEGDLIETSKGQDAKVIMKAGILPGISLRGYGDSYWIWPEDDDEDGVPIQMVTELHYEGFDLVLQPADHQGAVKVLESFHGKDKGESITEKDQSESESEAEEETEIKISENEENSSEEKEKIMDKNVIKFIELAVSHLDMSDSVKAQITERVLAQKPIDTDEAKKLIDGEVKSMMSIVSDLAERAEQTKKEAKEQVDSLVEATGAESLEEAQKLIQKQKEENARLKEAQEKREVAEFIDGEFENLTWPKEVVNGFKESVSKFSPTTIEEAKGILTSLKPSFDAMAANLTLASKGFNGNGYQLSDVLEEETGYPSYAGVSYKLSESLFRHNAGTLRDFRKPVTGAEKFTASYLALFDEANAQVLAEESRRFNEALVSTDLNLPYSVMRTIITEVFPVLTAASVYDFGTGTGSTVKLWYEEQTNEPGLQGSVVDEATGLPTFAVENGINQSPWIDLANGRLIVGTVVVTDQASTPITDDGTNFVIDHEKGRVKLMQGGSNTAVVAAATDFLVSYDYYAIRGREDQEIEQAKTVLKDLDLPMRPDRLAIDITKESIVWSQQDLSYDTVARNLSNVISQLRTKIDRDIHMLALNNLLTVQNNVVGTWTQGTDDANALADLIGRAKVAVTNRHYTPTRVVMSVSNADYLSNADSFNAAGDRADASLQSDGFIGRVKGLPVTETANFVDSYVEVVLGSLLSHRVSRGMEIEGPFPKYGANGKLIANDQYYVEEFNGSIVPVPKKGALVKIA